MPLYVHSCLSQVSGIVMMVNCLISVVLGLCGSGKHGAATVDEELAICPFMYKYFRIVMLSVSIILNFARFIYECVVGDVMLISVFFRCFGTVLQLLEHLYLCKNYARYFAKLEGESFFWTRGLIALGGFCGLGIFSGLEGVNGYGKSKDEQIFWSLALCLLIWGGLIWGRWQPDGLSRAKYVACRWAFALCFLTTLILVIADPAANGVVNRIVIGVLFIIATIILHNLHRRDVRDFASIDGAEVKERSRRIGVISEPQLLTALGGSMTVAVAPPLEEGLCIYDSPPQDNNIPPFPTLSTQPAGATKQVGSTGIGTPPGTEAQTAHSIVETTSSPLGRPLSRPTSRRTSYDFVHDARRGRLINDMYMSKAMAILGQVVGWYCFIFIVELCVVAYFVTNFGSPPKVCPSFSSTLLPLFQVVVDGIF